MSNDIPDDRRTSGWLRAGPPTARSACAVAITALVITSVVAGVLTGPAVALRKPSVDDVQVINPTDADGDGWASSFQVQVHANTDYAEPGGIGKGDSVLGVTLNLQDGQHLRVIHKEVARKDGSFVIQVDSSDIYDGTRALVDPTVVSVTVSVVDGDKGPGILGVSTADMPQKTLVLTEPMGLEQASNDRLRKITFSSNVEGASVLVDGTARGTTPWTGSFPVDYARRNGKTAVTFRKDGYRPASVNTHLTSSDISLRMEQRRKPILVTSDTDGATVFVDDERVGTTPWVGQYWVKGSHTVRVEKSGYVPQTFTDVSPEASIHASLISYSDIQIEPTVTLTDFGSLNSTTTTTTTPSETTQTIDANVTDFGSLDSSTVATGSDSFDFATYLPTVVDTLPDLSGVAAAKFSAAPGRPIASQAVSFDAADSYSLSGQLATYRWSFGDGGTARGETVSHAFDAPGTYDVELTVVAQDGTRASTTRTVTVEDQPPTARLGYRPGQPVAGSPVTLDATASTDPDGAIANYQWQFDDGTTASGATVNHTFSSPGTHDVALSVADGAGNADSMTRTVTVLEPNEEPNPTIRLSSASVETGESVTLDASGSTDPDGQVQKYGWVLDDATVATSETFTHTFSDPGTYEVRLTVLDDRGGTETVSKQIEVTGDPVTTTTVGGSSGSASGSGGRSGTATAAPGFSVGASLAALFVAMLLFGRRD